MPTFLVLGATGGTGRHFISLALEAGHQIRAIVRTPSKIPPTLLTNPNLKIYTGSITDDPVPHLDEAVAGSDYIVSMLGDAAMQNVALVNRPFIEKQLVPAMRRHGVKRILYQAGGLTRPYKGNLPWYLWIITKLSSTYTGQHEDNYAVIEYFNEQAMDIEWIVHRAGIGGQGTKGTLRRSPETEGKVSIGTFEDCAAYNLRTVMDREAVRTTCLSCYE